MTLSDPFLTVWLSRIFFFGSETIGDSYVACAGVPEADPSHAVKMARFAYDCVSKAARSGSTTITSCGLNLNPCHFRFLVAIQMVKMSEITKDLGKHFYMVEYSIACTLGVDGPSLIYLCICRF